MNHDQLMTFTATMPLKVISVNGEPYLERYFAGLSEDGGQWWYHRFLRADAERHLHNHPWHGRVTVLRGKYTEEYLGAEGHRGRMTFRAGAQRLIVPQTTHRIIEVEPNTWTFLYIEAGRLPTWSFIGDDGKREIMQTSPEDWHLTFPARQAA
jgi:hypothetical protein